MAERRMFAKTIIDSDAFLDMPLSTQALYFHLSMRARDGGVLNNALNITKYIGADVSDLDYLKLNNFVVEEDDGWYRIVHWKQNNGIGENIKRRNTYDYRKWRSKVIERDKVCQMCGSNKNLEAHHIKPFSKYPDLRLCLENGITLCRKCHRKYHAETRGQ